MLVGTPRFGLFIVRGEYGADAWTDTIYAHKLMNLQYFHQIKWAGHRAVQGVTNN